MAIKFNSILYIAIGICIGIGIASMMPETMQQFKNRLTEPQKQARSSKPSKGTTPCWLVVDMDDAMNIQWLKARPRPGFPKQFWKDARLEGSNDGTNFTKIADVTQPSVPQEGNSWLMWETPNSDKYRYYRLAIRNGHSDGRFFSFSELELGNSESDQLLTEGCTFTSSPCLELCPPENLIDGDPETFWHVKT